MHDESEVEAPQGEAGAQVEGDGTAVDEVTAEQSEVVDGSGPKKNKASARR